ncbi:pentatricopeptide repeat-containing protein At2g13600 [Selaginella moellendorffii]|nr:pentatricopeptide repeat-containing protein At2g13600 [Selaginella moellendorffii]|eukprot:XP_002988462.2 pentatricopeptide repeat-containing protein At2g13600 [Selaginella moellendorffii]
MIEAYAENRQPDEARRMFDRMPRPDDSSWPALIRAYAIAGFVLEAKIIFDKCPRQIVYAWSAMVAAYAQNGDLDRATQLFEEMPVKNSRAWNAIIAGHAQKGDLVRAESAFSAMPNPNATSWNALIHAYARSSQQHHEAIHLSRRMILAGVDPDDVTFVGLLNSCNHAGLLEASRQIFLAVQEQHFEEPTVDHYCCLINALGRAGRLGQAEELVASMPFLPDAVTWTTLLNVCKLHGDVELGAVAARHAFELDPRCPSPYLLLVDLETPPQALPEPLCSRFTPRTKTKAVYFGTGRKAKSYKEIKNRKLQEHDMKKQRMQDLREVLKSCNSSDPQKLHTMPC